MAVTQKAPVGSTFADTVSDPAWKTKATWYQVSTNDRMIHPDTERRMAARMNPRRTIELDASHASLASRPAAIVNLIDEAATSVTLPRSPGERRTSPDSARGHSRTLAQATGKSNIEHLVSRTARRRVGTRGLSRTGRSFHEHHHRRDRNRDPTVPRRVFGGADRGLRRRIAATRWPSKELVDERSQGVQLAAAQALARYWLDEYDFGRVEARLNELPQFVTQIDGVDIHFIHVMSSDENALPLIMTHGWPGSVIELLDSVGPADGPDRARWDRR